MDSKAVVQFGELVRQQFCGLGTDEVQVWLGDIEQVRTGQLPAVILDELCPACHQVTAQVLAFLGNWNQFTCMVCGFKHSEQLVRASEGDQHAK